ncbi:MAG TPA: tetratricopeptide repeat protein [Anaerolineae bacterium]|nr:tetratricopeptide repeat protein [Anaerolineae bacterium]
MASLKTTFSKKSIQSIMPEIVARIVSRTRGSRVLQILIVAAVIVLGVGIGTLISSYLHSTPRVTLTESYDAESARNVTPTNTTDSFIASLQTRLTRNPSDWQGNEYLGIAYMQKARETGDPGYYGKADELLHRALSLKPDDFGAMSALGALALSRHQFREALEWGERAKTITPFNPHNYGVIGDAQIELGMYDEATQTIQTMINQRPDLSSYSRVSYVRELHGDLDGAIAAMQQAVTAGGPNAENTNWVRVQLGNLYFNRGQLEQAEQQYQAALANYPNYVYALAALGRLRAAQGKNDEAVEYYTQAIGIIPLPQYVIELGDLYTMIGKSSDAARMYDLVRFEQDLYQKNGVDVDMELALFDADHSQNLDGALTQARAAYSKRPSIHAADVLAWTLYRTANYAEAQKYSREALRLGTQDPLLFFHAAMIAYKLGDDATAKDYLDKAILLNPHFSILYSDAAQQWLAALRAGQHPDVK